MTSVPLTSQGASGTRYELGQEGPHSRPAAAGIRWSRQTRRNRETTESLLPPGYDPKKPVTPRASPQRCCPSLVATIQCRNARDYRVRSAAQRLLSIAVSMSISAKGWPMPLCWRWPKLELRALMLPRSRRTDKRCGMSPDIPPGSSVSQRSLQSVLAGR